MSQTNVALAKMIAHLLQIANRIGSGRLVASSVVFIILVPVSRLTFLAFYLFYNISALQSLADNPSPTALASAGPAIQSTRHTLTALRNEADFILQVGPSLKWIPLVGPDLVYANDLLNMATEMVIAADETYQGLSPLMTVALEKENHPTPSQVLEFLTAGHANFNTAQAAITAANEARSVIPLNDLSPIGQQLISKSDRVLLLMRQGIAAINLAPALLGAEGSKTYLMLIQNQDELRPTGGFLSAAGLLTIQQGDIISLNIQDSYAVGNYSIPDVPGPLANYMDTQALVFRDANWSPDFPTSAALAIRLYQGDHPEAQIDGVIALDQTAISILLKATGPINVENVPEQISADNVIAYMRSAWSTEPEQSVNYEWWLHRKDFIQNMAGGLIKQLAGSPWAAIGQAGTQALRERHIQVWLQDKAAGRILAEQGWDGAIRPGEGDYLFITEANLGFNKVNAVIQRQWDYVMDLSNLAMPTATVRVTNFNPATGQLPCSHDPNYGAGQYQELINRCYWNYIRVYTREEAKLINASLHDIPAEWILTGRPIVGAIDSMPGEHHTISFGSLMVVPYNTTDSVSLEYSLPPQTVLLNPTDSTTTYSLHIQKQSGLSDIWMTVRIILPPSAKPIISPLDGQWQSNQWSNQFSLKEDTDLSVTFESQ